MNTWTWLVTGNVDIVKFCVLLDADLYVLVALKWVYVTGEQSK